MTQVARVCARAGCEGSLEGRRRDAVYCSASCRSAARHQRDDLAVRRRARDVLDALPPELRTCVEDMALARALHRGDLVTIRLRPVVEARAGK
jgi:hypothetical protein